MTMPAINNEFSFTPAAGAKMVELLNNEHADGDTKAIRIFVSGGGCSGMRYGMRFADAPNEYDAVFDRDGVRIFVDCVALAYLEGVEIDFVESDVNTSFVFNNAFQSVGGSSGCTSCGSSH